MTPRIAPQPPKVPDAELLALRAGGLWPAEIARRLGLNRHTVIDRLGRLRRQGVPVPTPGRPRPSPWRRVSDEEILALTGDCLGRAEIPARVGLSPMTNKKSLTSKYASDI